MKTLIITSAILAIFLTGCGNTEKDAEIKLLKEELAKIKQNQNSKEIALTNIQIDKALKEFDINTAIEQIKILNVYDMDNKGKQNLLNCLERFTPLIVEQKFILAENLINEMGWI